MSVQVSVLVVLLLLGHVSQCNEEHGHLLGLLRDTTGLHSSADCCLPGLVVPARAPSAVLVWRSAQLYISMHDCERRRVLSHMSESLLRMASEVACRSRNAFT